MPLKGSDRLLARLKKYDKEVQRGAKQVVAETANDVAAEARKLAPTYIGQLGQSIVVEKTFEGFGGKTVVNSPYAAYMEFGTGSKVVIPAGYEDLAAPFKGKGKSSSKKDGKFKESEFFKAILAWVKKKGLTGVYSIKTRNRVQRHGKFKAEADKEDEDTAYLIAISILKNGVNPHPFLIPAFRKETTDFKERIKEVLSKAKQ